MHAAGVERVVEMGPGKVLAGLNKRIEPSMPGLPVQTLTDMVQVLGELAEVKR
jgi:[acyl-carrier-protein] S-malonyltransferase